MSDSGTPFAGGQRTGGASIVTAALVGVGCSSAAVLILEVVLTRVFAVAQFYHFAFLAVSLALLGYGASGSVPEGGARADNVFGAISITTSGCPCCSGQRLRRVADSRIPLTRLE